MEFDAKIGRCPLIVQLTDLRISNIWRARTIAKIETIAINHSIFLSVIIGNIIHGE